MDRGLLLSLGDLTHEVALVNCPELRELIARLLHGWSLTEIPAPTLDNPSFTITQSGGVYTIETPWVAPFKRQQALDTACGFIAELIRDRANRTAGALCLHGAAAVFAGKLVIFPSRYRAGKSVLCAYLAAHGIRLFADDVLMIGGPGDHGIAPGFQPRLRLPLPDNLTRSTQDFIERHQGPENSQYRYLDLSAEQLAKGGESAPIGAFVLLERISEGPAAITPVALGEALRQVIWQNFARQDSPASILTRLHAQVAHALCFKLRYSSADEAVALLRERFSEWPDVPAQPLEPDPSEPEADWSPQPALSSEPCYQRNPAVSEVIVEGERFLAESGRGTILSLNATASALWHILSSPTSRQDLLETFRQAFPDAPAGKVEADVTAMLADLTKKGLLIVTRPAASNPSP